MVPGKGIGEFISWFLEENSIFHIYNYNKHSMLMVCGSTDTAALVHSIRSFISLCFNFLAINFFR